MLEDMVQCVLLERQFERLADQRATGGNFTGQDDLLRREQVGEVGRDQSQVFPDLFQQVDNPAIARVRGCDQVGQREVIPLVDSDLRSDVLRFVFSNWSACRMMPFAETRLVIVCG